MSILTDPTGDGVSRTTGSFLNPSGTGDISICYWVTMPSIPDTHYRTFSVLGDATYTNAYIWVGAENVTGISFSAKNAAGTTIGSGGTITKQTQGIYQHIAVTYDGFTRIFKFYINGIRVGGDFSLDMSATTFSAERLCVDLDAVTPFAGTLAVSYYRSFAAELTISEIKAEMRSPTAVKASPFCDTPLTGPSDLNDISGNARHWSAVGSLGTDNNLTIITTLTNIDTTNAQAIGTFGTWCENARDSSTHDLWFKIATSDTRHLSIWHRGSPTGGSFYRPDIKVFDGKTNADANTIYLGINTVTFGDSGRVVIVPCFAGHTYYVKLQPVSSTDTDATAVLSVLSEPTFTDPLPSTIFINSADDGFPLTYINATNGKLFKLRANFPAGELAHRFVDGRLLVFGNGSIAGLGLFAFDSNFNLLAGPISDASLGFTPNYLSSDRTSNFLVAENAFPPTAKSRFISASTWALDATTYNLPIVTQLAQIAVSLDKSTIYYVDDAGLSNVHRWNTITNSAMSDVITPPSTYELASASSFGGPSVWSDILVLPDGSLIIGWEKTSTDIKIGHYSSTGLQLSLTQYLGNKLDHLAHDLDSLTTFWAWFHSSDSNSSIIRKINVSDGSIALELPPLTNLFRGILHNVATLPYTPDRFGPSSSCNFWVGSANSVFGGIYIIVPGKTDDTVLSGGVAVHLKKPNPTWRTASLGL